MRALVWLLSAWLALSPALADSSFVAPTSVGTASPGQVPGTTTNDLASAGNVGEYKESQCSSAASTITVTIASPAVVTYTSHPYSTTAPRVDACPIVFTNSGGALPTGITSGTNYWIIPSSITTNTFQIATTVDNAIAGTAVNTSGSQSGTHTGTGGVALTSGNAFNLTAISLTAGTWDVQATCLALTGTATSITALQCAISSASATNDATAGRRAILNLAAEVPGNGSNTSLTTPTVRLTLSATTTYYAVPTDSFSVSTLTGWGSFRATRVR